MAENKPNSPSEPESRRPSMKDEGKTLSAGAFRELPLEERVRSINASFLTNTILANRFQVVRFIARGGMGEVYEAEDLVLKERVAVKCIRFEYAQHENATERFKREIQLARKEHIRPFAGRTMYFGIRKRMRMNKGRRFLSSAWNC